MVFAEEHLVERCIGVLSFTISVHLFVDNDTEVTTLKQLGLFIYINIYTTISTIPQIICIGYSAQQLGNMVLKLTTRTHLVTMVGRKVKSGGGCCGWYMGIIVL